MHYRPGIFPVYICWDLNACPPPKDKKPYLICRTIYKAARRHGLGGEPQIRIYYTRNTLDESTISQLDEFDDAGCIITSVKDEFGKVNTMLVDMHLRALNYRDEPTHFVVITKIQQDTEYLIRALLSLEERGGREAVYLILPDTSVPTGITGITTLGTPRTGVYLKLNDGGPGTYAIQVWACNLLESIMEEDDKSDDEEEQVAEEEEVAKEDENGCESLDPLWSPTYFSTRGINRKETNTSVLWDVEDYPLSGNLSLNEFYENIKCYLKEKAASNGDVIIWAYVPDSMMEAYIMQAQVFTLERAHIDNDDSPRFIFVPKVQGDKYARLYQMLLDLLLWAIDNPLLVRGPEEGFVPNLLVISKNIEAKTLFCPILEGLRVRGYNVFLTLPRADDVAPKDAKHVTVLPWEDLVSHKSV